MKTILLNLSFLFLLSCNAGGQELLSPDQFEAGMKKDSLHQLLDVRTPEEYDEYHLANAINNNFNDEKFIERLKHLDKDKPVYVYCLAGGRSASAHQLLKEQGFKVVYDLDGGIRGWENSKKPVIKAVAAVNKKGMSVGQFNSLLEHEKVILVDFNARWCPPCRKMAPYLEKLKTEMNGRVNILPVDVDGNKELADAYKITTLPSLILFKDKVKVWEHVGFISESDLRKVLQEKAQ